MLIIGEKLNSAIPSVRQIINDKNAAAVQDLARRQAEAGADYLDLNTAHCDEVADMEWLVRTVQEVTDVPLCIDSTAGEAIKKGLETVKGDKSKVIINSISMEKKRLEEVLPLVLEYQCPVIGLTVDDNGIPKTAEERIKITEELIETLSRKNYDLSNLYIDPLVLPLAVNHTNAVMFFQCLRDIKRLFKVKTVSGLSNISFNMPKRKLINRYFLTICMASGMDAAILDPLDGKIMTAVTTTDLLLGNDRFGKNFLKAYRKDLLAD
ncbi:5-methyltetrahydrofolate:corrinoid/iron-sulfur protein co-methyltransferase [Moorella thermoacetica]|uniref:5-methyltetrahydrofolate:corrinoid/iron-sulfur protein co-methyltransferase n=1 Tax=Neomoorella thermoacetica TaxID=1525 RepID=A0AAC9HI12_NEOTH|nr:methyltetrahydrofolate cobalamin methyltransferase [Moorella thermoacetica]AOQ24048.1 5-methyltetrahydrofolate:corrinoid/iron-sulfur protein co-methyltransferase [Moorella thermoacetica]TYL14452.1 5-methyltetrahydrofolate:corrinoid/iron-sulfur protein co-methyltransferase [Moorella thermoacetica]